MEQRDPAHSSQERKLIETLWKVIQRLTQKIKTTATIWPKNLTLEYTQIE